MLDLLAKDQDKWESMARTMGCPEHLIGDVVQDMYLKIYSLDDPSRILYNESEVNHFYVYLTLRSSFVCVLREEGRLCDMPSRPPILTEREIDRDKEEAFKRLWDKVTKEISSFGPYGAKLTNTYFKTDISIRSLATESGISATSIYHSIKAYREYLRETTLGEDWEDYCNGDYDKV